MKKKQLLFCTICLSRNYNVSVDTNKMQNKLELNKYCPKCAKHTLHKQS